MKGWQNQISILQKINCSQETATKVIKFEQNEYLQTLDDGFILYQISLQDCCSLRNLIDSLKLNFVKIYKGQALIISIEILKHLTRCHSENLCHGKLDPKNIYIQLKLLKNNKFTLFQVPIYIKSINFLNYKILDDEKYSNQREDIKQIIMSLQQFFESIEDYNQCQLLQLLNKEMQQRRNQLNQNSLSELNTLFNNLILGYVVQILRNLDEQTQQIRSGIYNESPYWGSVYGYRPRCENAIMRYIDELSSWDLNSYIAINRNETQFPDQETVISEEQAIQLEDEQCDQVDLQIKEILQNYLKSNILMKNLWATIGQDLNQWGFSLQITIEKIKKNIDLYLKILNDYQHQLIKTQSNLVTITPKKTIDGIEKSFKFEFQVDALLKDQIQKLFIKYLQIHLWNFDLFNDDWQKVIEQIEQKIEIHIQQQYEQTATLKIYELVSELI